MGKEYKKVQIIENYTDNGEFSHYSIIENETGEVLCSEEDKQEIELLKIETIRLKSLLRKAWIESARQERNSKAFKGSTYSKLTFEGWCKINNINL